MAALPETIEQASLAHEDIGGVVGSAQALISGSELNLIAGDYLLSDEAKESEPGAVFELGISVGPPYSQAPIGIGPGVAHAQDQTESEAID